MIDFLIMNLVQIAYDYNNICNKYISFKIGILNYTFKH